jgi:ubiquinone/menaquinone biosynthesis C-methylase UbiE
MIEGLRDQLGRRFARVATVAAVRTPRLWAVFRPFVRGLFDAAASRWDSIRLPDTFLPYETALESVSPAPSRALDLGTGTGFGAFVLARRFPGAQVVGADLSGKMLEEARKNTPAELRDRVTFQQADASNLPYADAAFDLVAHANMIPFFDEVARVVAPGGQALFAYSSGATTPIYVPSERLREELERRGFTEFAVFDRGRGTALLARKVKAA